MSLQSILVLMLSTCGHRCRTRLLLFSMYLQSFSWQTSSHRHRLEPAQLLSLQTPCCSSTISLRGCLMYIITCVFSLLYKGLSAYMSYLYLYIYWSIGLMMDTSAIHNTSKTVFYCHFPDLLLAKHTSILRKLYHKLIDMLEEVTTGMADLILVNSKFTASIFARTFRGLHARGIEPAVLYPAVSVEQFDEPRTYKLNFLSVNQFERKKNLDLAISTFALLPSVGSPSSDGLHEATLTIAGGYDKHLKENVEYLDELRRLAVTEGVSDQVTFVTSCSTSERNELLSNCLCVLHTPKLPQFYHLVGFMILGSHSQLIGVNRITWCCSTEILKYLENSCVHILSISGSSIMLLGIVQYSRA